MAKAMIVGGGPDLGGIGAVGRVSKGATAAPQSLTEFTVKKGDDGGVLVCETYAKQPPAGRRAGAAYPGGGDYKDNPFSPEDGAAATSHITDLLSQMGVAAAPEPMPEEPMGPSVTAARGPRGAALGVSAPPPELI